MSKPDVTVLFPCLNEEEAIGRSVRLSLKALADAGLNGEVLVIDNASEDRSAESATAEGARVVLEPRRGYGSAYLRGLAEAYGDYIVMLDADGTYPEEMIGEFVRYLRDEGAEMVLGNRFGGMMQQDAMPWANRYIGNPVLSGLTRVLFKVRLQDMHCGMRAIRKDVIPRLGLQGPGMEFATEMVVKALDVGLKVKEVTIPYRPRIGDSKLNPIRDAWRHVEYMLVFSPATIFLWPGLILLLLGMGLQLLLIGGPTDIGFRTWDVHSNIAGLSASLTGSTLMLLGFVSCAHARNVGMEFRHSGLARWVADRGDGPVRIAGLAALIGGLAIWGTVLWDWLSSSMGTLAAVPVLTLATSFLAIGLEWIGAAFLTHLITLSRPR